MVMEAIWLSIQVISVCNLVMIPDKVKLLRLK